MDLYEARVNSSPICRPEMVINILDEQVGLVATL